ncbi:uncharacterized protein N7482_010586 [Penicillium canariense]|uniref:Uncharacterized protein n=1 Tax=Penicillium canariense TaxID=189055 RepID=A0A9W9HPG7_9EURO|nr:uncharacterized protein N7482_010586 [Penicillium canariense]KAJ5151334.1 hypothetical protein N7482_010586 [Penicillium canariense]
MAAPSSRDATNLAGVWNLNRTLSDDPDKIFALQGVPWVVRQVLRYASLSLSISQSICLADGTFAAPPDAHSNFDYPGDSVTILDITQNVYPGNFNSEGIYHVNGKPQNLSLPIFGDVVMQLSYINASSISDEKLRQTLSEGSSCQVVIDEIAHNSSKGWEARVFWGFEYICDKRYFTRNAIVWKGDKTVNSRMVYDFRC